jgi:hypothetical protein
MPICIILNLFNDAVGNSDCVVSSDTITANKIMYSKECGGRR